MGEYYFNLPALATPPLTRDQRSAIYLPTPIALSGGPGTGKSVVSLYRHLIKSSNGGNCQLLTYTTTLALYLQECCRQQNPAAAANVKTTLSWAVFGNPPSRDEIIIDEAQDLKYIYRDAQSGRHYFESEVLFVNGDYFLRVERKDNTYKFVNSNLDCQAAHTLSHNGFYYFKNTVINQIDIYRKLKAKFSISYGADTAQMLLNGSTEDELKNIFTDNQVFRLSKNFRNTKKILKLAKALFPSSAVSENDIENCTREGELPIFHIANFEKQDKLVLDIIAALPTEAHNIDILCPWQSNVKHFYDLIRIKYPNCSYYISDRQGIDRISNIHITTFKSAKGLEFDTVIIPDFHKSVESIPERFNITWKDYYVAITRTKSNLYLISNRAITQINNLVE